MLLCSLGQMPEDTKPYNRILCHRISYNNSYCAWITPLYEYNNYYGLLWLLCPLHEYDHGSKILNGILCLLHDIPLFTILCEAELYRYIASCLSLLINTLYADHYPTPGQIIETVFNTG